MMNRINHNIVAESIALQKAAGQRHAQSVAAKTTPQSGAQYNFAELFGSGLAATSPSKPTLPSASHAKGGFDTTIATATASVIKEDTGTRQPASIPASTATTSTSATPASTPVSTAAATTPALTTQAAATPAAAVTTPGVEALVTAIMNGSFKPTYVTDPNQLKETTPVGTDTMPNFYYASDQTAAQLAQLLGGTVIQRPAFGQVNGWTEPMANFIQLPNGQTFNAADLAYYANCGNQGASQLTADITATINTGSAWTQGKKLTGRRSCAIRGGDVSHRLACPEKDDRQVLRR